MSIRIILLLALFLLTQCTNIQNADFSKLDQPYFGQAPPGENPEIFAPGIISQSYDERMIFFILNGNECFFQLRGAPHSVILHLKNTSKGWTKPEIAFFSGQYFEEFGVSQDGKTIVFTSNRPIHHENEAANEFYLWKSIFKNGQWTEPEFLGEQFKGAGYPTISNNGNIYFFGNRDDCFGKKDIYVSYLMNGKYKEPINLGDSVNTPGYDVDPFISPDESYLIYASYNETGGLYISYKQEDGKWTRSRYMGDELGKGESICPSVSSDGKYLFFMSMRNYYSKFNRQITYDEKIKILNSPGNGNNDIYWVDASVIENYRPEYAK